jgi:hypothetical protein
VVKGRNVCSFELETDIVRHKMDILIRNQRNLLKREEASRQRTRFQSRWACF